MSNDLMNRIHNSRNPFQGKFRKTLTVCSAGLLRSPTTAFVLSLPPYNRNVRACGSYPNFALVPIDDALIAWADEIVFVAQDNFEGVTKFGAKHDLGGKQVYVLDLPDIYQFRDPTLIGVIKQQLIQKGFPQDDKVSTQSADPKSVNEYRGQLP